MAGYVYLLGSWKYGWYKIGKSKKPEIRIRDIGVLLPFKIKVIAVWRVEHYHALESWLHREYDAYRVNGEWFQFERKQLQELLLNVAYPQTEIAAAFSNMQTDDPPEKIMKLRRGKDYLMPEERERRKQEAIANRNLKKQMRSMNSLGSGI